MQLQDLDVHISLLGFITSCVDGDVAMPFMDGSTKRGTLSSDFTDFTWSAKRLDLEKAYRQVPVSANSLKYRVILVHNPSGEPCYFVSQSLPFGACSSVYAFNRLSAALRFLLQKLFKANLTCFYDDFPFVEPTRSSALLGQIVARF